MVYIRIPCFQLIRCGIYSTATRTITVFKNFLNPWSLGIPISHTIEHPTNDLLIIQWSKRKYSDETRRLWHGAHLPLEKTSIYYCGCLCTWNSSGGKNFRKSHPAPEVLSFVFMHTNSFRTISQPWAAHFSPLNPEYFAVRFHSAFQFLSGTFNTLLNMIWTALGPRALNGEGRAD